VDKVKKNPVELEWGGVYWVDVAQDRNKWIALVNAVTNFPVP
jgi:hypothetical protein